MWIRSLDIPAGCRADHWVICQLVERGSRVLDLGSGEGDLLKLLTVEKEVQGMGVEVSEDKVYECVNKGLCVQHGDIDEGLSDWPDRSFDYVILSQTLQEILHPVAVIQEMLRVGRKAVISFPNFAHCRSRWHLLVHGTTPILNDNSSEWYETPNIQFVSIRDFYRMCAKKGLSISENYFLSDNRLVEFLPNFFAETAVFVLALECGSAAATFTGFRLPPE